MWEERNLGSFHPSTGRWLAGSLDGWLTLALCLVAIGIPLVALIWIKRRCTIYKITNQRLILQTGIIFRRIDEIELYRVKDVRVDYSILNQLLNIGTITLSSSDKTTKLGGLRMYDVKNARPIREALRNLVEAARQRRGVRELDGTMFDQAPYSHNSY